MPGRKGVLMPAYASSIAPSFACQCSMPTQHSNEALTGIVLTNDLSFFIRPLAENSFAYVFRRVHGVSLPKPVSTAGAQRDAAGAPLATPQAKPVSAAQRPPALSCTSGNLNGAKQGPLSPVDAEKRTSPDGAQKRGRVEEAEGGGEASKKLHVAGKVLGGRDEATACASSCSCCIHGHKKVHLLQFSR